MSPLLKILLQKKHKQKSARGTQNLKETEKIIQDTIIANKKSAINRTWICFEVEDNQLYAREGEKMLNSVGLRLRRDESVLRRCLQDEGYRSPRKTETRRTPRLEVSPHLVYGMPRKTRDTAPGKERYPPGFLRECT